jgi:AcrR family transcriptional regulator
MATASKQKTVARSPKQERSRTSLRRLMETATAILEEEGYADFTLQDLSKRAKVSIGSIYHLFENKQQLVREVQVQFLEQIEREHALVINAIRREGLPLRRLVPLAIRDYSEFLRKNAGMLRVFMQIAPTDPVVASNGKKYYHQSVRDFELLILDRRAEIRHPDPEHAVTACYTVMYAAVGRYLGLGTTPDAKGEGDWDTLIGDLGLMILHFLLGNPDDVRDAKS